MMPTKIPTFTAEVAQVSKALPGARQMSMGLVEKPCKPTPGKRRLRMWEHLRPYPWRVK